MTSALKPRPSKRRRANSELQQWRAKFLNFLRLVGANSTAIRYDQALTQFFLKNQHALRPEDVLRHMVEDYKVLRRREGASNATINIELSAGKSFYDFIARMSETPVINPFTGTRKLRVEERPKRALPMSQVERIFAAAEEPQEILLATLAFTTGLRGEEMVKVEKQHFDLENSRLILPPAIVKGKKRGRTLPVREDLKQMVAALPDGRLFQGWAESRPMLWYRWRRLLWKAGVPMTGLHATRHTFGTQMIRNGADIATVRDLLGHASIRTTGGYLAGEDADAAKAFLTAIPRKTTAESPPI
jgi:integrase